MKRLSAVVLTIVLVGSGPLLAGCGSDSGSTKDTSSAGKDATPDPTKGFVTLKGTGFTLKLPSKASRNEQTVDTTAGKIKVVLYNTADDPDGTYVVALTGYPTGTVVDLDGAVDGAARNVSGTVKENTTTEFKGHEAREARFTATSAGTELTVFALVVDLGGKLFQLQCAVQGADVADRPEQFDAVASSVVFE